MDLFFPSLTLGLITSLHCVSMCGPMVVTYALKGTEDGTVAQRVVPNLAYQAAKIVSYMLVGLLLGAVGSAFDLDAIRPYVMLVAGAFMIVLALGMTGRVQWAARFTPRPPTFLVRAFTAVRRKAVTDAEHDRSTLATPITFGLLTGLMPCAPLMAAQLNAAASGSAVNGAIAMFAFGLGTAPLMLGFGTASSLIPRKLKERVMVALAVVVLVFGVTYLNRGAMLLGSPVTLQSVKAAVLGGEQTAAAGDFTTGADGVVEVPLTIANVQFQPATVDIPADVPVRLIVDRQEANACSDQLAVPQLGVLVDLAPNAVTVVELPAAEAGTYTLTCGMGMMSGQLRVGAAAGGSAGGDGSGVVLALAIGGILAAGAALARTAPAEADRGPLGLTRREVLLAVTGIVVAVLTGLAFGGLL
ncbi:MAG: sulfite exporter TauE/SafE family protein [Coriobacteriia bacterium]|nr:sulfite exporter TauE/SafE family protein [Coriobacteriia bacterium]MBN2847934.1 sulfite exporter TauE/SafE family protein [Coriobacteriia bacterium]